MLFDPKKSLFQLAIFWWPVVIIIAISFLLIWIISSNNDLKFCLEYECFNNLLSIYRVPLGFMALGVTVAVLIASNHRSVQTKAQIEESQSQNIFSNYYRHVEEFEGYVSTNIADDQLIINNIREVHFLLYPDSKKGFFSFSQIFIKETEEFFTRAKKNIQKFDNRQLKDNEWKKIVMDISEDCNAFHARLNLVFPKQRGATLKMEEGNYAIIAPSILSLINHHSTLALIINKLLAFDQNIDKIPILNSFYSINYQGIQNIDFKKADHAWVGFRIF